MATRMPDGFELSIIPGKVVSSDEENVPVLVSLKPPSGGERTPSDICCVIDISWSMSMEATIQTGTTTESNGLSLIDIAKHAVRTVVHTLGDQDRLSLVTFCETAQTVLTLTAMDEAGKAAAEEAVNRIGFGSGTQLGRGIMQGIRELETNLTKGRFQHMMLLTDGETQDRDAVIPQLAQYKSEHGGHLPGTINVFGFGYEIDSALLATVASLGSGSYAFIPDAGFVGTIFVNSMSNLLATVAKDTVLTLQAEEGAKITEVLGSWEVQQQTEGSVINLGCLQSEQTKDIVVHMSVKGGSVERFLSAKLGYTTLDGGRHLAEAVSKGPGDLANARLVWPQKYRSLFVDSLASVLVAISPASYGKEATTEEIDTARAMLESVAEEMRAPRPGFNGAADDVVKALLEDVMGQCTEAVSRVDWYIKWGRHYLPSVMSAHQLEQCNNFKDPGVQGYGGKLFNDIRDLADEKFCTLAAPVPTPAEYRYYGNGVLRYNPTFESRRPSSVAYTAPPTVSMAAYHDAYAGCIDGSSLVTLASGKTCRIDRLSRGDSVRVSASGDMAEVACIARTTCMPQKATLVELARGLRLTPFHPVKVNGSWRFPRDIATPTEYNCEALFSLVLRDAAPEFLVAGIPCIALGHDLKEGAAAHPYFGSQCVLKDLSAMPGWTEGLVNLRPDCERDPVTGMVRELLAAPAP